MDIFLSWSGDRSKRMAQNLKDWLPVVFDNVEPWFSNSDIQAGERWSLEVGRRLEKTNFGIICLTRDNLESPWILFEAGALSKALEEGHVCPYLLDVEIKDIAGPLSQFQAKRTDKSSTLELLKSINNVSYQIEESRLAERFEGLWPSFERKLATILETREEEREPTRPEPEILEELVETVRGVDRRLWNLGARLELFESLMSERRRDSKVTALTPSWNQVIQHMKTNRNIPAAAVYEEAWIEEFDGSVLELAFPEDLAIYAKLASDARHVEALQNAMEAVYGARIKEVKCVVADDS